jgi:hypothetical protein
MTNEHKEMLLRKAVDYPCPSIRKKILRDVFNECGYTDEYYKFCRELQDRELDDEQAGACCGSG